MPAAPSIFRREVSDHARQAWLGRVVLIRPMSFTVLALVAGTMAFGVLAYLGFGEYTKKASVPGLLIPDAGLVKVIAHQAGVVVERRFSEGSWVGRGEPLFVIADLRGTTDHAPLAPAVSRQLEERRRSLAAQVRLLDEAARTEVATLEARAEGLRNEAARLDAEVRLGGERVALSSRSLDRARALAGQGFVSPAQADQRQEESLEHQSRLQALERSRAANERERRILGAERASIAARHGAALAALGGQRAALEQERVEREVSLRSTIVAPQSGRLASVVAEPGQSVTPGATLSTLVPDGSQLQAHLFAPSRAIGFIRTGQEVLLRFPAFPYQKFGAQRARVLSVAQSALPASDMGFTPTDGLREPLYRIKVAMDAQMINAYGRAIPLQPGMQVDADIHLDRRRLIEWIFEPLIGLAGRLG